MSWNDERVATLKRLWIDGLSAAQIAGELGGVTRNAVIGKVLRLGLEGRKPRVAAPPRPKKPRRLDGPHAARPARLLAVAAPPVPVSVPEPDPTPMLIPLGQRCTLLELKAHSCRWPVGDPCAADFFFCGGRAVEGLPYCGHHVRLAYEALRDRRREHRAAWR